MRFFSRLTDLFYPAYCELCEVALTHGHSVCPPCLEKLPRNEGPSCTKCGEVFEGNITSAFQCPNCASLKLAFDFAVAPLAGSPEAFTLVHGIKYLRKFHLAKDLGPLLQKIYHTDPRFLDLGPRPLVIPVPLYWKREQHRHRNQAAELARSFALVAHLQVHPALKRIRRTETQTRLSRQQRLLNLKGAFQVRPSLKSTLKNHSALLIDDVFTTGSTVNECAKTLRKEGLCGKIAVLTAIRG